MRAVRACPICEESRREVVCEYNRFIVHDEPPDPELANYAYALCWGCGLTYATRRPEGEQFVHLLRNFDDSMARPEAQMRNPILSTQPLTDESRAELRRRLKPGVFVDSSKVKKTDWLPTMLADRLDNAAHLELLLSLIEWPATGGKRVVEVRSRTGYLLDSLRRLVGAEVYAMPLFESQQLVIKEAYGITSNALVDYDHFTIPYEGQFDLIICKHTFTHSLRPEELFEQLRGKLAPGGYIYMYREATDDEAVAKQKNMFIVMNPFHFQSFDEPTYARCLRRSGFEAVFRTNVGGHYAWLAKRSPEAAYEPASKKDIKRRSAHYRQWRDYSLVTLHRKIGRERVKELFGEELEAAEKRGLSEGWAVRDKGRVKVGRKLAAAAR